ncbi:MAG: TonB-dependent receptor [Bacteroidales bacterium]|nr:TonB-dependent receptor [Bacteroidales bacterium]MBS3777083.1 TonB-dependent receptor [Bacteroidales bacterium]
MIRNYILIIFLSFLTTGVFGQPYTISGHVQDQSDGEVLIGANISLKGTTTGTTTNAYGFYSITLEPGEYTIACSYVGYSGKEINLELNGDTTLDIELERKNTQLEEVVVEGEKSNSNIVSMDMSLDKLNSETIDKIPVLMGEVDMIKTLQMLPGVKSTGTLTSGMSVRGGGRDQNLIQLDEAPVYNASHLGGIFSVFNNDAIKNVELYKGKIPARYGGRLSSLIDIRMKDGNMKEFAGEGGIGLISSRLTLEGPVVKDKGSFIVSGRRTYMDAVIGLARDISGSGRITEFPFHFYDLNAKVNYRFDDNNRLYLSGYFGRDVFSYSIGNDNNSNFNWGNYTATARWNHVFNNRLFSNFTLMASNYDYLLDNKLSIGREKRTYSFEYGAFVKDLSAKTDFTYYINNNNTMRFGLKSTYHDFNVGDISGIRDTSSFEFKLPAIRSIESAFYLNNEQKVTENFTVDYGFRYSVFQNIGKATVNVVDDNYNVVRERTYDKGEIYNTYHGIEPRIGMNYVFSENRSVKASYSRTRQYLLIASNSNTGSPLDVWISANPNIKPQIGDQYSLGYFRNFLDDEIETSFEMYYKDMQNLVAFKEFAQPQFNPDMEEELRFGKGRAYGFETTVKKAEGNLSGWISYSFSRSMKKIKDIQEKDWFPSPYDRPHDLTLVAMYDLTRRISLSANWTYKTGRPLNAPAARYEYGNLVLPYYPGRNKDRMPDYHRLDVGLTIIGNSDPGSNFEGEWVFSVYNAYARKNADAIYFTQDKADFYETKAMRTSYFTIFPSVTYNFKF